MNELIQYILNLFTDPAAAQAYLAGPGQAMTDAGLVNVSPDEFSSALASAMPGVDLPPGDPIGGLQQVLTDQYGYDPGYNSGYYYDPGYYYSPGYYSYSYNPGYHSYSYNPDYNSYAYYDYAPGGYVAPAPDRDVAYCTQRYRSYDPASGTYLGYDGLHHPCP